MFSVCRRVKAEQNVSIFHLFASVRKPSERLYRGTYLFNININII